MAMVGPRTKETVQRPGELLSEIPQYAEVPPDKEEIFLTP